MPSFFPSHPYRTECPRRAGGLVAGAIKRVASLRDRVHGRLHIYANGGRAAHQIGLADWPVPARLELDGKLTFKSDDLRRRFQAMKPCDTRATCDK